MLIAGTMLTTVGVLFLVWASDRLSGGEYRFERLLVLEVGVSLVVIVVGVVAFLLGAILAVAEFASS